MSQRSANPEHTQAPGVLRHRPEVSGHKPTVLLIEDDRAVSKSIARLLRANGYEAAIAEGGSYGLRVIEANVDIDVVLLDIVLPDMTGTQVAALIKAKHPDMPIIFATGVSNVGELNAVDEKRLLRKPFSERELFDKIAAAMNGA